LLLGGVLGLRRLWELPPSVTMCATIVLTIFSGAWSQIGFAGLPLHRLLAVVVLLQVFLRAPGVAHIPRLRTRNVHLWMGLTVFYVLASAAAAGTLGVGKSFLLLLDVLGIAPYLLFLVAPAVFARQSDRNLLLATLVGLGAYLGITAIFESLGPHSLVFPSYIHQMDALTPGELKPGGPFQSTVAEGFATFACAVAAAIAFNQWSGRRRYLAAAVALICAFGCFLTLERGVWIAAVVATVVTALATQPGRRWIVPGLLACTIAIAGTLAVSSQLASRTSARANYEQSLWDRQNQTSAGLRMVDAKPLFGFGWDRFVTDDLDYFRQAPDYPMTGYVHGVTIGIPQAQIPLHNTYLSYAVELGLVGALLWLASLVWAVGGGILSPGPAALRPWKLGLLALAVFFLVVSFVDPHQQPFPLVLLFTWAGVAWGSAPLPAPAPRRGAPGWSGGDLAAIPA
jgi:putative inorganic carbon (HCO3(-)) transporter